MEQKYSKTVKRLGGQALVDFFKTEGKVSKIASTGFLSLLNDGGKSESYTFKTRTHWFQLQCVNNHWHLYGLPKPNLKNVAILDVQADLYKYLNPQKDDDVQWIYDEMKNVLDIYALSLDHIKL
ncbi:TPA: hypothetical protein ACK3Q6_002669 [Burkholderia cepacia]|uniref:hypothetical protein n=1 Tax=Burkholderia cepacia TaxID=292 RepID=UPI001CF2A9C0|nr:hypothetical protein [Burkholderia cepacia]HDR9764173.1 hypothetical protein [Burkholderia cepacia ATCC 25416]MCA8361222.1 hypothetical protein [Burkholderia cepacia]HDR9769766.1 hypothetical protein [Burkholderia cepacia ATCC 25416]HDR9779754.1 hypothetical protein [Burkholderia cepacia ATCC 25416]HDR9785820.1 hypothetical protein [Burkholderia cepacia ATCC 25416]